MINGWDGVERSKLKNICRYIINILMLYIDNIHMVYLANGTYHCYAYSFYIGGMVQYEKKRIPKFCAIAECMSNHNVIFTGYLIVSFF